jgi:hypothetical protein
MRQYFNWSTEAAVCALTVGQGFDIQSQPMLSETVLEVTAHIMHQLVKLLGDDRDEKVESERKREKWGTLGSLVASVLPITLCLLYAALWSVHPLAPSLLLHCSHTAVHHLH